MAMLHPRDRRALILGGAIMLGLVGVFRGLPAWRAWRAEARAAAAEAQSQAARSDALVAGLRESLDTLEARTALMRGLGPALLTGDTPAEAGSALTALLGELARQSLVRLEAVDIRIDTTAARSLPRVAAEVHATADITGLSSFLAALERGPTLLAVHQLAIRPQTPDGPANQVELLSIHFRVEGLALVRAPGGTS